MIERLKFQNFTALNDIELNLSSRVNVIIGTNGTGKTHLLKAAYALCIASGEICAGIAEDEVRQNLTSKLVGLFSPIGARLGKLHRNGAVDDCRISIDYPGESLEARFSGLSRKVKIGYSLRSAIDAQRVSLIPAKEALSFVEGVASRAVNIDTLKVLFDESYLDLIGALTRPTTARERVFDAVVNPRLGTIIPELAKVIGGTYEFSGRGCRFYPGEYIESQRSDSRSKYAAMYADGTVLQFKKSRGTELSPGMTAEGFRKLGTLQRLIETGAISSEQGGCIFWDEPEANLNPKLMQTVVEVLLKLARNGQQVILATHDYVILKWFDLLIDAGKEDHVRYHALYRDGEDGDIKLDSVDDYLALKPNSIADTFNDLTVSHAQKRLQR